MHNTQIWSGEQRDGSYNFDAFFAPVQSYLQEGAFSITTFEAALAGPESGYTGYPVFNSPDEIAYAIDAAGFDLVNLANNHMLDRGVSGTLRTIDVFKQAGIQPIGAYKSQADRDDFFITEINDIKIGCLSYTEMTNGIPIPADKPYLVNLLQKEQVLDDIAALRPQVDAIVLVFHWGVEYFPQPTKEQEELAREFLEAGADMIIGSHPHVIQPMKIVEINGKKKLIAYAIGNFIGHQNGIERNSGCILKISFQKNFTTQDTVLSEVSYTPTYSHPYRDENGRQKFEVVPVKDAMEQIKAGIAPHLGPQDLPTLEQVWEQTTGQLGKGYQLTNP